ncbi:hypothetical protein SRABI118_04526 [Massilia sp. Bi118]|nr:hypothetical protein SRABI118_04526 [Massilia sp. Bi118]
MYRNVLSAHTLQHRSQAHIRQRRVGLPPKKHRISFARHGAQERLGLGRQWNTMFLACLHPFLRNRPDSGFQIDLRPDHATHFARANSCQDRELNSTRGDALSLSQSQHEFAEFLPRKRRVVDDGGNLVRIGQQYFQVPVPACRVITLAEFAYRGPIEDAFDTSSQATSSLRLRRPDRAEHFHYQIGVDVCNRKRPDDRRGIGSERVLPLARVLCVLPVGALDGDVLRSAFVESNPLGARQCLRVFHRTALVDRVLTVEQEKTAVFCSSPGVRQANRMEWPQPHFTLFARNRVPKNPALRAGLGYLKPKSRAIAVIAGLSQLTHP